MQNCIRYNILSFVAWIHINIQGVPKKMTPFVIQMIPNGVFFFWDSLYIQFAHCCTRAGNLQEKM